MAFGKFGKNLHHKGCTNFNNARILSLSLPFYLSAAPGASPVFSFPPGFPSFFSASRWIPTARHIECSFGNNTAGKIQSGVSARDGGARLIELVVRDFPAGCGRLGRRIIRCNPVGRGRRWSGLKTVKEKGGKKREAMSIDEWSQFRGKLLIGEGRIYPRLGDFETLICRRRSFSHLSADRSECF